MNSLVRSISRNGIIRRTCLASSFTFRSSTALPSLLEVWMANLLSCESYIRSLCPRLFILSNNPIAVSLSLWSQSFEQRSSLGEYSSLFGIAELHQSQPCGRLRRCAHLSSSSPQL